MGVDLRGDEQVARRTAIVTRGTLPLQAHAAAVDGAGGHLHRMGVGLALAGNAHGDLLLRAVHGLVEGHVERDLHVLALAGLRLAAEAAAEVPIASKRTFAVADALQNVGPAAAEAAASATAVATASAEDILDVEALATAPSMGNLVLVRGAVLVVELALLVVAQHLVGFVELLELGLVAAGIGVMLAGQLAKRLLDLVGRGGARNA